jgi:hypothetical protein
LLENKKLIRQLCALERRTARGGRDSVDHPNGQHDDVANAVAAAVVTAVRRNAIKESPIVAPVVVSSGMRQFPGGITPSVHSMFVTPQFVNPAKTSRFN